MKIYFSGIGGVGIGPLAMLAQDAGYQVVGSDMAISPVSQVCEERGIKVSYSQDGSWLRQQHEESPIDLFVYTAALKPDHPEIKAADSLKIQTTKRDQLLNKIIKDKKMKLLAVSGTHGKTTTTAMLIWLFTSLDIDFAHSVGTNLSFVPIGRYQADSKFMIYEADEYDKNFLQFEPFASIVTSIDYDHPDTYPSPDDYFASFKQFLLNSGQSFIWEKDWRWLGLKDSPNINVIRDTSKSPFGLDGEHNRNNAGLVLEMTQQILDVPRDVIIKILNKFPGSERRFEKLYGNLYSDYAHHPSEIKATIQMAKEKNDKVVVVYQPHQNLRQKYILDSGGYADVFDGAAKVYWLPTYLSRENPNLSVLTPESLIDSLTDKSIAEVAKMDNDLVSKIDQHLKDGCTVIAMSAGNLDGWLRQHFKPLS